MNYPNYDTSLEQLVAEQIAWSLRTFGPGHRVPGLIDHITKELKEVADAHLEGDSTEQLNEWIDIVILGLDGAWRSGHNHNEIVAALVAKYAKNRARTWPDWRTADPDKAIEHDRSFDEAVA